MDEPKRLKGEVDGFRKTKPQPTSKAEVKPKPKVTPKRSWGTIEDVMNAIRKAKSEAEFIAIGRDFGISYEGDYQAFRTALFTKAREIL
jgi:hypothetical protein